MNISLRYFILICGISFFCAIMRLLIKKKFNERNSLIWLFSAVVVLIFSLFPRILDTLAGVFGVNYAPSILFLIAILILMFICFYHSIQISILNSQIRELAQRMTIKELEHMEDLVLNVDNSDKSFNFVFIEEDKADEFIRQ